MMTVSNFTSVTSFTLEKMNHPILSLALVIPAPRGKRQIAPHRSRKVSLEVTPSVKLRKTKKHPSFLCLLPNPVVLPRSHFHSPSRAPQHDCPFRIGHVPIRHSRCLCFKSHIRSRASIRSRAKHRGSPSSNLTPFFATPVPASSQK